jgi:hypothetical protein
MQRDIHAKRQRVFYQETKLPNFLYLFSDPQDQLNFITGERKSTEQQRRCATRRLMFVPAVQDRVNSTVILYGQAERARVIAEHISISMNSLRIN